MKVLDADESVPLTSYSCRQAAYSDAGVVAQVPCHCPHERKMGSVLNLNHYAHGTGMVELLGVAGALISLRQEGHAV